MGTLLLPIPSFHWLVAPQMHFLHHVYEQAAVGKVPSSLPTQEEDSEEAQEGKMPRDRGPSLSDCETLSHVDLGAPKLEKGMPGGCAGPVGRGREI